jgi:hypothetical protein
VAYKQHWLERAEQCRRLAREANHAKIAEALTLLAQEYEITAKSSSPPSPPLARSAKLRQEKRFLVWGDSRHAPNRVERDTRA